MRNLPELGADFTMSCPESGASDSPIDQIRARGNLPLVLQEDMVIELKRSDILENWRETCALARRRINPLLLEAATRIHLALEDDEFIDAPQLASDAAAFFLLALRQNGVKFPCNMPPCAIRYYLDDKDGEVAHVVLN
jgi:hypothetical protein